MWGLAKNQRQVVVSAPADHVAHDVPFPCGLTVLPGDVSCGYVCLVALGDSGSAAIELCVLVCSVCWCLFVGFARGTCVNATQSRPHRPL